jgi:8-oxo-dGTP diphosphatase
VIRRLHHLALQVFRWLPVRARRRVVRTIAPGFTVGAICAIERADGALLLVRQSYRRSWGIPGGLLKRRERPDDAARREVDEEVGFAIELVGEPAVVIDEQARRVDLVYRARPAEGEDVATVTPRSPEITEARWFPIDALPDLQFETSSALVALARGAGLTADLRLVEGRSRASEAGG